VSDTFPAELTGVTWTCLGSNGGVCSAGGAGDIDESVSLPTGASVTFSAVATVDPAASGATLANTAAVACSAGVTERDPTNNTATDTNTYPSVIFSDGFESGGTGSWSKVLP
jgi:hypothetical protein